MNISEQNQKKAFKKLELIFGKLRIVKEAQLIKSLWEKDPVDVYCSKILEEYLRKAG